MKENDSYFKSKLNKSYKGLYKSIALLIVALFLVIVMKLYWVLLAGLLVFGIGFYKLKATPNKVDQMLKKGFKSETPDSLLGEYESLLLKSKGRQDMDAMMTYHKALVLSYYGQFDEAAAEMKNIDWENRIPYYQSLNLPIEVLRTFLQPSDQQNGLSKAKEMKVLGEMSRDVKGFESSENFFDTYIEIAEILNGNVQDVLFENMEIKFDKSPFFPKLLIAWALAYSYNKVGSVDLAKIKLDYCKAIAPHCLALQRVD